MAIYLSSIIAGTIAGWSVAAGGLALDGRALLDLAPVHAQLLLVLGPLLGLWPLSALVIAAARSRAVARRVPPALGLWGLAAVTALFWFGVRPLMT
ncbi:MAG: hypothetical protein HY332_07745 [Chloroflexi bacterium]|nr:hypothetical protein [Chloroflexota bacterium]